MFEGARVSPVGIPAAEALAVLRAMLLIRRFEERCAELYTLQKIRGFLHLYIGEEAVVVGAMRALEDDDAVVAAYREHGHALQRGVSPAAAMAEMYGKATGCALGRGGSMHLFCASGASTAATPSWPAACPSRWGSRSPTSSPAGGGSRRCSSATARPTRGSSTSR
ncbi:thiamine pyrophosphate-dependent enzyme [Sorangium sp. So ce302]